MRTFRMLALCSVLTTAFFTVPAHAQRTVDLTLSNKIVSGGFFYFDIHLKRTNEWTTNFLGDCSFYFGYNSGALSTVTLDYIHPDLSAGNGFSVTAGSNPANVYVTVDFGFGSSMSLDLDTDYKLITVKMAVTDPAQESDLSWAEGLTGVFNAADQSVDETYFGDADMSLPVTLSMFKATQQGRKVLLEWATEGETDNLGFIIERAEGAGGAVAQHAVPGAWQQIATYMTHPSLRGRGNTSQRTEYRFTDESAPAGALVRYRISDVSTDGDIHTDDILEILLDAAPQETALAPPTPNPFNPQTKISYQLAEASPVAVTVYDLLGRHVRTLVDERQAEGSYNIWWHGMDESGRKTSTGTYLIVLETREGRRVQKAVMTK